MNIKGRLFDIDSPKVMGIINVTPDSFYASSRVAAADAASRAVDMVEAGAEIIDLGAYSSRPGASEVSASEEIERLAPAIMSIKESLPDVPLSIDTFRACVARKAVALGADIINDIGGGELDAEMFDTVADLHVPYVLMHMRGTPSTMQSLTDYEDVTASVLSDLAFKVADLRLRGVADIIVDPGLGFAKTTDQNFQLLSQLKAFAGLECPLLIGISRKTMIWSTLGISPDDALNGTTALNMVALMNGASILRVHDVAEAVQTVKLFNALQNNYQPLNSIHDTLRH